MPKIAFINYLNSQPLYFGLADKAYPELEVVTATPIELIDLLHQGAVQAGQMSVYEYLLNTDKFDLHKKFCISSLTGKICSVLLLSKKPIEELSGELISLTDQSRTSVQLLKIILELRYKLKPKWQTCKINIHNLQNNQVENALLIGDQALLAWQMKEKGELKDYFAYDLAQEWFNWTGLPFVFAVFVSQQGWTIPPKIEDLLDLTLRNNLNSIETIIEANLQRGISRSLMAEYFQLLDYQLDPQKEKSIQQFNTFVKSLPQA